MAVQEAQIDRLSTYLAHWMERYLKNKDLIHKRIKSLTAAGDCITVTQEDRTLVYRILPELGAAQEALAPLTPVNHCAIITYQTPENFDALIRDWNAYANFKRHFAIYFVNPFSKQDKLWVIYPSSHNAVTEAAALKPGLVSIASSVEYTALSQLSAMLVEETA